MKQQKNYYSRALLIFLQVEDFVNQGNIYIQLATLSRKLRDWTAAQDYFEKALDIFLKHSNFEKPEVFNAFLKIMELMFEFAQEAQNKAFGESMIQKALPHFDCDKKASLMKIPH